MADISGGEMAEGSKLKHQREERKMRTNIAQQDFSTLPSKWDQVQLTDPKSKEHRAHSRAERRRQLKKGQHTAHEKGAN